MATELERVQAEIRFFRDELRMREPKEVLPGDHERMADLFGRMQKLIDDVST